LQRIDLALFERDRLPAGALSTALTSINRGANDVDRSLLLPGVLRLTSSRALEWVLQDAVNREVLNLLIRHVTPLFIRRSSSPAGWARESMTSDLWLMRAS
jgi:hypothetical protein